MIRKILVVSDTHEAFDLLSEIVSIESDADLIIHSGDFANIDGWSDSAQDQAMSTFEQTIEILKRLNKPIICVPGNHDARSLFWSINPALSPSNNVYILGKDAVIVENIRFIGLGGAPPGILPDGSIGFPGFPYKTSEDCDHAVKNELETQLNGDPCVLVTHFPPFDIGKLDFRGTVAEAGNKGLETFIENNSEKFIFTVSGHLHIQFWMESYKGTAALNAGSILSHNYAVVHLEVGDTCKVNRVELKTF